MIISINNMIIQTLFQFISPLFINFSLLIVYKLLHIFCFLSCPHFSYLNLFSYLSSSYFILFIIILSVLVGGYYFNLIKLFYLHYTLLLFIFCYGGNAELLILYRLEKYAIYGKNVPFLGNCFGSGDFPPFLTPLITLL